jgi:Family of unknown function (DUF6058)
MSSRESKESKPMTVDSIRFRESIDAYLHRYFCTAATLAADVGISTDRLNKLIASGLVPRPAYSVENGEIVSYAFGTMAAADAPQGAWFSPANAGWVRRALGVVAEHGNNAADRLKTRFQNAYREALRRSHASEGPLPGFALADGRFDDDAYDRSFDTVWEHFLAGTFSLCVANAIDEARIAEKETLQLRLSAATENGEKSGYDAAESAHVRSLIERYLAASMPFSPIEYARSSRRRLVEDVLPKLQPLN